MKINRIVTHGVTCNDLDITLAKLNLFSGPTGAGKSSGIKSINIGVLGYDPELGAKPGEVMRLANSNHLSVEIYGDGLGWTRTYERDDKSLAVNQAISIHGQNEEGVNKAADVIRQYCGDFPVAYRLDELMEMSPEKQRDFIFKMSHVEGNEWTADAMLDRVQADYLAAKLGPGALAQALKYGFEGKAFDKLTTDERGKVLKGLAADLDEETRGAFLDVVDVLKKHRTTGIQESIAAMLGALEQETKKARKESKDSEAAARKLATMKAESVSTAGNINSLEKEIATTTDGLKQAEHDATENEGKLKAVASLEKLLQQAQEEAKRIEQEKFIPSAEIGTGYHPANAAKIAELEAEQFNDTWQEAIDRRKGETCSIDAAATLEQIGKLEKRKAELEAEITEDEGNKESLAASSEKLSSELAHLREQYANVSTDKKAADAVIEAISGAAGTCPLTKAECSQDLKPYLKERETESADCLDLMKRLAADGKVLGERIKVIEEQIEQADKAIRQGHTRRDAIVAELHQRHKDYDTSLAFEDERKRSIEFFEQARKEAREAWEKSRRETIATLKKSDEDGRAKHKAWEAETINRETKRAEKWKHDHSEQMKQSKARIKQLDTEMATYDGIIDQETLSRQVNSLKAKLENLNVSLKEKQEAQAAMELTACALLQTTKAQQKYETCQDIGKKLKLQRDVLVGRIVTPLERTINAVIGNINPAWRCYFRLEDAKGRPDFEWGLSGARCIAYETLSRGQRAMFGTALIVALLIQADPALKVVAIQAGEADDDCVLALMAGLSGMQEHFDLAIVEHWLTVEKWGKLGHKLPDGWKVHEFKPAAVVVDDVPY